MKYRSKSVIKQCNDIIKNNKILEELIKGNKVEGYILCPSCKAGKRINYCRKCDGWGFIKVKKEGNNEAK